MLRLFWRWGTCVLAISLCLRNFGVVAARRSSNIKFSSSRNLHMANNHSGDARGALIVLEGLDRSGKTSQSRRLLSYLDGLGHPVESWRFPDRDTSVGKMISSYLSNESNLDDRTIHLLFSANRWEKRSVMEAKLKSGTSLIVDRYSYSGVAFQHCITNHLCLPMDSTVQRNVSGPSVDRSEDRHQYCVSYMGSRFIPGILNNGVNWII